MKTLSTKVPRPGYSPALDGVRGLAVLLVFLSHSSGRDMAVAGWLDFQGIGRVGVYLFFALSAFLISSNLDRDPDLVKYFFRRFFRIAPLYYLVLVLLMVYQGFYQADQKYLYIEGPQAALRHFLFLEGDGVFWTIPTEIAFYVLLPVFLAVYRRSVWWICALAIGLCMLYVLERARVLVTDWTLIDNEHGYLFLDVFLMGLVASLIASRGDEGLRKIFLLPFMGSRHLEAAFIFGFLLLLVLLLSQNFLGFYQMLQPVLEKLGIHNAVEKRWLIREVSIVFGYWAAVTCLVVSGGQNPVVSKFFGNRLLRFSGMVAFSWYLLHFAVFQFVNTWMLEFPGAAKFLLAFSLTAALSAATYRWIERPGMKLGELAHKAVTRRRAQNQSPVN